WVPEPIMRGAASIFQSCLLPIFACVYTALHLNIPRREATASEIAFNKISWMGCTFFSPEIVLYYAFAQWRKAKKLMADLRLL
ncbi:hypothetical protein B0T21DRAFT_269601, partial [Apiosordaria backusii]